MNPRAIMVGGFAISLGIICYQDIAKCKEAPWPPRIIGTGIVFGLLDLFSLLNEDLASVVAVGIVLALLLNTLVPVPGGQRFQPNCGPHSCATAQPSSYQTLQNAPTNQGTTLA